LKEESDSGELSAAAGAAPAQGVSLRKRWTAIALAGAIILAGSVLVYWLTHRLGSGPPELKERRLTASAAKTLCIRA